MAERITGHTELIGLMAYPIRHSSSPAMQNEAFAKLGYDYAYLAFEVGADEIEDAVKAIRTLKMRGSNVSMPNKTLVGKYLDELSPAAELCGAVNTIVNDNGHLTAISIPIIIPIPMKNSIKPNSFSNSSAPFSSVCYSLCKNYFSDSPTDSSSSFPEVKRSTKSGTISRILVRPS